MLRSSRLGMSVTTTLAFLFEVATFGQQGQPGRVENAPPALVKPVEEVAQFVTYPQSPASVTKMVELSDAVVKARFVGRRPDPNGKRPDSFQLSMFDVIQVLKADPRLGAKLELPFIGGDYETDTKIVRTKTVGVADFVPGHQYLIFLDSSPTTDRLRPIWGPASFIDVTGDGAIPIDGGVPSEKPKRTADFIREATAAASH